MSFNSGDMYDIDSHIAEVYDQLETDGADVMLILRLIAGRGPLHILEPFCGSGRILIPLVQRGHILVGLDRAHGMLSRAQTKLNSFAQDIQTRMTLIQQDVVHDAWPQGFDVVILGGNCLYELATADEQEACIRAAAASLKPDGYLYIDNNHMEGELEESWRTIRSDHAFPSGVCADGTQIQSSVETIWYDASARLARFRRHTSIVLPDSTRLEREYIRQTHPVSRLEVQNWLTKYGFIVEATFGDRAGNPYFDTSERAIFWTRKCS